MRKMYNNPKDDQEQNLDAEMNNQDDVENSEKEQWEAWALEQGELLDEIFGVDFIEVAQENEEFMQVLLNASMSLVKAYVELIHDPELIEKTQNETYNSLMTRNSSIPTPTSRGKNKGAALDVSSMSEKDIMELDKKARYGAKIVL